MKISEAPAGRGRSRASLFQGSQLPRCTSPALIGRSAGGLDDGQPKREVVLHKFSCCIRRSKWEGVDALGQQLFAYQRRLGVARYGTCCSLTPHNA
jgi:hypothetical protein